MKEALAIGGLVASPRTHFQHPCDALSPMLNPYRTLKVEDASGGLLQNHSLVTWDGEERVVPRNHVGFQFVNNEYGMTQVDVLKSLVNDPNVIFGVPILHVDDPEGHSLRHVTIEPRVFHRDCPKEIPVRTIMVIPELALLHYPRCFQYKENLGLAMKHASPERGALERNAFLKFREALETSEAMAAFDTLFRHYSLNEELCRLDEWMKVLPFTLEEHPRMQEYRKMLEDQIGHLRQGAGDWYANGSPSAGIQFEEYIRGICTNPGLMPFRLRWLAAECRKRGFKKVAEWGSVEGVSLFHLLIQCPDIDWYGFESNPSNRDVGHKLAAQCETDPQFKGLKARFHLDAMNTAPAHEFDAIALFEALEHNSTEEGAALLKTAEERVRPGGMVFITTPHGNWSAWDEHTRDLSLRKDHINAYTVARMEKFLTETCAWHKGTISELKVEKVDNPTMYENNAWVHASYRLKAP